jgi:hypothetical protein
MARRVVLQAHPYKGKSLRLENTQDSLKYGMPAPKNETRGRFCDGIRNNIVVQCSVGHIITLHGRITAREYMDRLGKQVHPMIQTLFPNNDTVFQVDNTHLHTDGTVQS